jgi:hypothetical protein
MIVVIAASAMFVMTAVLVMHPRPQQGYAPIEGPYF